MIKKQDLTEDKIRHAAVCLDHFISGKVTRLQLTMKLHIIVGDVLKSELPFFDVSSPTAAVLDLLTFPQAVAQVTYISPSRLRLQRHDCVDMGHVLLALVHFGYRDNRALFGWRKTCTLGTTRLRSRDHPGQLHPPACDVVGVTSPRAESCRSAQPKNSGCRRQQRRKIALDIVRPPS